MKRQFAYGCAPRNSCFYEFPTENDEEVGTFAESGHPKDMNETDAGEVAAAV
jgi:hypothetical protein